MGRKNVKLTYITNKTERKVTYQIRQKGFLKKAQELSTLCGIEMTSVIYSPYTIEPVVFPNREDAINTFTKFRALPRLVQSKHMVTGDEFTKKMIAKMEKELQKIRKKNRTKEIKIMMNEVVKEKDIPTDLPSIDINDLIFMLNQHLNQICEEKRKRVDGEGSTSNASQPTTGPMVHGRTNLEGSIEEDPVSMVPLVTPSMVPVGTNFERQRSPLFAPDMDSNQLVSIVAPLPVLLPTLTKVPQQLFHLKAPLRTPPQMVPFMDPSWIPLFSLFSSQIFSPIIPQVYSSIPQQMDLRRTPIMTPPIPTISMASLMPSLIMASPMSTPVFSPMTPQNSTPSEWIDRNSDNVMDLFDDLYYNDTNVQDPNHNNNL
ncbi:hypothetical protein HAX54_010152 [Datura stramonium]|uniref:MADS-box domain-containing protein n=1 Tax=Datura stramonium TaxID=4076 RepID=A0ABS8TFV3_DATST|nr:hypothetical protein [Datura stramonium]